LPLLYTKVTNISREPVASIFRVEDPSKTLVTSYMVTKSLNPDDNYIHIRRQPIKKKGQSNENRENCIKFVIWT